ncbi:MAG: 16S rRNA (cytosine(1402)-N(4))-methyltransferase RsmH [Rikenellaceae bacterium]
MENYHIPVLFAESIDSLEIEEDGIYVDLTFGGGGHSRGILSQLGDEGILFSFDQDADVFPNIPDDERLVFVRSNFKYMRGALRTYRVEQVNGIFADLGVSSHHFDASERGFSFRFDAPLDMRMNQESSFSALNVVNEYEHADLLRVLRDYGEMNMPHKVASAIERARPIATTNELCDAVRSLTLPHEESKYFAKMFQAIRIEVNGELEALKMMLEQGSKMLGKGGIFSIITYHSLEDRLVKNFFKAGNFEGVTETDFYGRAQVPFKAEGKVIVPSEEEIERNPRSRSAKLRVAKKL